MQDAKYGINMKKFCKQHEEYVLGEKPSPELLKLHMEKVLILQHERLVHLIVTVMVVFVELFLIDLTLLHAELGIYPAIAMLAMAILLGFYFRHYFFLENTVQKWYLIADEIRNNI